MAKRYVVKYLTTHLINSPQQMRLREVDSDEMYFRSMEAAIDWANDTLVQPFEVYAVE